MDAGHEPVAGAGAEARANVDAARHSEQQHAGGEVGDAQPHGLRRGQQPEPQVDAWPDKQNVQHSAEPGALAQRNPEQQHCETDDVRENSDAQASVVRDPLRKHGPGIDADGGANHEGVGYSVEQEAGNEAREFEHHVTSPL
ncbi:hypothetical protein GCM10020360_30280 [Nonlabens tegetincola]